MNKPYETIFLVKTKFVNYVSLIDSSDFMITNAYRERKDAEDFINHREDFFVHLWKNNKDLFVNSMNKQPEEFETEDEVRTFARKHYHIERVYLF